MPMMLEQVFIMHKRNEDLENDYIDEIALYIDKTSRSTSTKIRKLKARRKIEDIQENKRLRRQIDSFYYD